MELFFWFLVFLFLSIVDVKEVDSTECSYALVAKWISSLIGS